MKWTQEQKKAIELRNTSILVSAAAGSGKTAVLVARIEHIITGADISENNKHDPVPIDRMLVVTFTNAAASEMKEKISAALNNAALDDPKNLSLIQNQLYALQNANISTFHSFAMEVVRRYFHLTDIDPDFKICDEVESTIMKSEAMDRVFEAYFAEENQRFLDFLKDYGDAGNENRIKEELDKLYTGIMAMADPWRFMEDSVGKLSFSKEELKNSSLMDNIWQTVSSNLEEAEEHFYIAATLISEAGLQKLYDKIKEDISFVLDLREKCDQRDHERFGKAVRAFSAVTLRACKEEKDEYNLIKEMVKAHREKGKNIIKKEIKEKYFKFDLSVYAEDINKTYNSAQTIRKILMDFHEEYMNIKLEKNLLDFGDIEHYAIRILKDPSASAEYRDKFDYIFIDEYQDSNYLQEEIINSIKREDNVFMVGDIKQSIYKFRLAEPEIFKNKYLKYSQKDDSSCTKIDLNMNFRSKGPIINTVNSIFAPLMKYEAESALYKGIPEHESPEPETEIHIIDSDIPEENDMSDELIDMKNAELEAVVTAGIIKNSIGREFYDTKKNKMRKLLMKDIVILMRGVKNKAEIFRETLALQGIDTYIDDNSGYFDTLEILTFIDILKVIDNSRQDIPLLGVLRCPIFGFTIEELIKIRIANRDIPYHEALSLYSVSGDESILAEKATKVISKFEKWKKEATYTPLDEFVWKLMDETGYYVYVGSLPGGMQRQANLRAFIDRAALFRKNGGSGIYGLLKYTEALKSKKIDISQADIIGESDDIVRIMTIHKSKGLEFPMVIVASLGRKFNSDKAPKKGISMHKDLGIGLDRVEHEEHWHRKTLIRNIIKDKKKVEALEEETRILYVAFTRAMDRLVLLGSDNCFFKNKEKYEAGLKSQSNYLGMIYPFLDDTGIKMFFHERASIGEYISQEEEKENELKDILDNVYDEKDKKDKKTEIKEKIKEEINKRLSWVYPNEALLKIKSKYSVSELNAGNKGSGIIGDIPLETPEFLREGGKRLSAAQKGTAFHRVMEHLDFTRMEDGSYIRSFIDELVDREIITEEEKEILSIEKIEIFAESMIGKRAKAAAALGKLRKETSFNLLHTVEGKEVMVQGIIDCWFEEKEGIVLLDYKTNYDVEGIQEKYKEQIMIYKKAIETYRGMPVTEAYLYLISQDRAVEIKE